MLVVALSLLALLGGVGLAVDSGRIYLAKTELQNAADACALAAVRELAGVPDATAFARADQAGQLVALRHQVDFQGSAIQVGEIELSYGAAIAGPWAASGGAAIGSGLARCQVTRNGLTPWVLQVLGVGAQRVSSVAVALLVAPTVPMLAQ